MSNPSPSPEPKPEPPAPEPLPAEPAEPDIVYHTEGAEWESEKGERLDESGKGKW